MLTTFKFVFFNIAGAIVPGAGAFEIFAWQELQKYKDEIKGKSRLGIQAFAEALLIIPKTICEFNILTLLKFKKHILFLWLNNFSN